MNSQDVRKQSIELWSSDCILILVICLQAVAFFIQIMADLWRFYTQKPDVPVKTWPVIYSTKLIC